jgi:hypothetical protein
MVWNHINRRKLSKVVTGLVGKTPTVDTADAGGDTSEEDNVVEVVVSSEHEASESEEENFVVGPLPSIPWEKYIEPFLAQLPATVGDVTIITETVWDLNQQTGIPIYAQLLGQLFIHICNSSAAGGVDQIRHSVALHTLQDMFSMHRLTQEEIDRALMKLMESLPGLIETKFSGIKDWLYEFISSVRVWLVSIPPFKVGGGGGGGGESGGGGGGGGSRRKKGGVVKRVWVPGSTTLTSAMEKLQVGAKECAGTNLLGLIF